MSECKADRKRQPQSLFNAPEPLEETFLGPDPAPEAPTVETTPEAPTVETTPEAPTVETVSEAPLPVEPPTARLVSPAPADPFDPARLRLAQNYASTAGVRRVLNMVPVKPPQKEWWIRTHPSNDYWLETAVIELKEDREIYLIDPALRDEVATEPMYSTRFLATSINRQGVLFLWGLKLPGPDGKPNPWHESALDAANRARQGWIRVAANMSLGAYEVWDAPTLHSEPKWPDVTFSEILKVAFRDRMISEWNHPILRRLRGEA